MLKTTRSCIQKLMLATAAALLPATVSVAEEAASPATLDQALERLDEGDRWKNWGELDLPRHPAERFLEGMVIALDPGHGGDAHQRGFKRGPTGVREADINWRVAVLLEKLLMDAGAHVVLTRHGDYDVGLRERAEIANTVRRPDGDGAGADLFISLHHNATGNPETNYTTVWFHGEADWSEPDLDIARHAANALFRHLRTDAGLTSALMSDQQMYPGGFGVLRRTRVPAVLLESSFHTNPEEEQRLRDAFHNLREAYAVYIALCEYAYGGRPTQGELELEVENGEVSMTVEIDDGLPKNWWGSNRNRTLTSSIQVFLDDQPIASEFDPDESRLTATFPLPAADPADEENQNNNGRHVLRIHHANFAKHHNWPQRYLLSISPRSANAPEVSVRPMGPRRTSRDPELREDPDSDDENEPDETEAPVPTPLELAEGPEANSENQAKLRDARPGDVVQIPELTMNELPRLPIRLTAEEGPQLVFSDMPEYFRTGDGIAMSEPVDPGAVRLYLYHVPASEEETIITAVIENTGEEPLNLRFTSDAFPEPNTEYPRIAREALGRFFERKNSLPDITLKPGEIAAIDPNLDSTGVSGDALVHGFYEFEIDQPAKISTLRRPPEMSNAEALETLEQLPKVLPGHNRSGAGRGVFPIGNFLTTLAGSHRIDTARGAQQVIVADGKVDRWIKGTDSIEEETVENRGNYGVLYRMRFTRESSDGRSLAVLMHNPFSEGDPCYFMGNVMAIGSGGSEKETLFLPRESHGFRGDGRNVLLRVFPPLPEGESETIEILYSPPGSSCLPTPLFFVPFE